MPRAPRYARHIVAPVVPAELVERLARARIGTTFNQYARGPRAGLLRERLVAYLEEKDGADLLLVGEAPGYRGARVSGIPFTSERQLTGRGPAEATATIVRRVLDELGIGERTLLWNVVPTHPHEARDQATNRRPTVREVEASAPFLAALAAGRRVIAVGRLAESVLGIDGLRHPSHGGARAFRDGLRAFGAGRLLESAAGGRQVRRLSAR
ncbi:MAG TPA: uracil-DNA glycosylase [Gaiellaceae bacterium]|nr:uracil-DNA glycosylase [Gaiellaceae bacterium]